VHFKTLAIYSSILLFVIIFIAYFVGKGDVDNTKSIIENFDALYKDIVFYLLGGVVAFNNVVMYPGLIPSNGGVLRFFVQTANSLGLNVYVPNLHMQYSNIGPGLNTNVYTIFGSYYIDFGIIGTCVLMFLYGLIMYIITQKAKKGNNIHSALYAYFMAGLILSIYSEHFMTDLNYIIKLLIVLGIVELIKRLRLRRI
jgi:oligosaccharide repeat unit polymerase